MRISTQTIFDSGVNSIQRQTSVLIKTQQQVATGRRVLTPADDPVAAARILEVTQSRDVNTQFIANQTNSRASLTLAESQLSAVSDLMQYVRERAVQAANATLTSADRGYIAEDLRSQFEHLLGLSNATDGTGQFLFSGYQGATKPFSGNPDAGVTYAGDEGQRALQVSGTRRLSVSDSGNDIFMRIRNGNGTFVTDYGSVQNTGTASIDAGNVLDPALWDSAANSRDLEIRFWNDTTPIPPVMHYDLVDRTTGVSLLTNTPSTSGIGGTYLRTYSTGQAISFSGLAAPYNDFGIEATVSGDVADGDAFAITSSTTQSIFDTLANMIAAIELPITPTSPQSTISTNINFALRDLGLAEENVLRIRASVGSRLSELDALGNVGSDVGLQLESTLSGLQDLDYAEAISRLTRQQSNLEAAQRSFLRVSDLSLFNFL